MTIKIQGIEIDAVDYAIRANANLGIKDTGKTYAATWFAEQLMKHDIPIVAISPSPGKVWRYLKFGRPGFKGFPVVIVGDDADLPLSKDTAGSIMRAAMQEGVSVVFDIFSKHLSKTDWRHIVTDIVNVLLFENEDYGLRHVFLEECKDYVPQTVYDKITYSAVEKFVREGGNSKVGVTLINQRAEGVNKEVLELCASLILFKQTGRNSITNLDKWFQKVDIENRNEIVKSLYSLQRGQCWLWDEDSRRPVLVQIPEKDTVHPDRREMVSTSLPKSSSVDVSEFVERMSKALQRQRTEIDSTEKPKRDHSAIDTQSEDIKRLSNEIRSLESKLREADNRAMQAEMRLNKARELLTPQYQVLSRLFEEISVPGNGQLTPIENQNSYWQPFLDRFGNGAKRRCFEILIQHKRLTAHQMRLLANGGSKRSVSNYISEFVTAGLARRDGNMIVLREIGDV